MAAGTVNGVASNKPTDSVSPLDEGKPRQGVPLTDNPNPSSGWLPAVDDQPATKGTDPSAPVDTEGKLHRTSSILRKPSRGAKSQREGRARAGSIATAESTGQRSLFTNADGAPLPGSAFLSGAGTVGPGTAAVPDESLQLRATAAGEALSPKQRSKVQKSEVNEGKRLSKVIRAEAVLEKQSLQSGIRELSEIQRIQKEAAKASWIGKQSREAKLHAMHSKAVAQNYKDEEAFLAARAKYETSLAEITSLGEALEIIRSSASTTTGRMQDKVTEIDALRTMYGVDERERAVKVDQLSGRSSGRRSGWFHR
ncbi:hypothetical protein FISHEDRAFT_32923 [Fistulina hepatica ATCC 64428]|uniref:DNA binding protein Ncp1 n=1 Tax=Fistulina hepatica ATCC 64428 TaxID=1128425 RepID=A0A0D7APW7_9AGAR|nr:hypothetical protein FISHEDRAFT_32923 [Fistulina hepatica ATCC 64428]